MHICESTFRRRNSLLYKANKENEINKQSKQNR